MLSYCRCKNLDFHSQGYIYYITRKPGAAAQQHFGGGAENLSSSTQNTQWQIKGYDKLFMMII